MQPLHTKKYINVYLSLGSNMGNRRQNIEAALVLINKQIGKIARKSHYYETQAWGETNQDPFLNMIVMANTSLEPRALLEAITKAERELGRERKEKWGPRVIDIDIVFYGKRIIRDKGLEIPHPDMHKRAFVLVPMMELDPEFEHPTLHMAIDQLYMECEDQSDVVMLDA
jgi:2-amino-4-hydroxy-6-hydroxymethyldihydropteridine diphosphokinase